MRQLMLMVLVVVVVGCVVRLDGSMGFDPIVEKEIRKEINKPKGGLTKTDLEKVTRLSLEGNQLTEIPRGLEKLSYLGWLTLDDNQLTDVKGLEKLTWLEFLGLMYNPDLTKAQMAELKKALPKCAIGSDATK